MEIIQANAKDAEIILNLQKLAYQSEAKIYQDFSIPPLIQTLDEIRKEFETMIFLKAVERGEIIGSVRAYSSDSSCFIGRLIVRPDRQGRGIGTQLMDAIERRFTDAKRYELFTGTKSVGNIRLYKRLGYEPFREQVVSESLSLVYMQKAGCKSGK